MGSEPDGYDAFFEEQYPQVVAVLIAYRHFAPQIAEEAAAEAMTRLYLNWAKVRHPKAWVRTVAVREACRLARDQHAPLPETERADSKAGDDLAAVELALMTGSAVRALPPRQREVMVHVLADLKPEEIAGILGCTSETARSNIAHARRNLKRTMRMEEEA
ncbi:RNA polymerase sigma factor [Streptomyces sp. NPDC090054]|uniref:RNA polymerase sigma factor n=1 Tax=Streptomyces sp. NPDC090054 TaxID=3365933 RepID=UPI00380FEA67